MSKSADTTLIYGWQHFVINQGVLWLPGRTVIFRPINSPKGPTTMVEIAHLSSLYRENSWTLETFIMCMLSVENISGRIIY